MDRDALRAWKRGHELAEERTREQARSMPIGMRVEQLVVLARTARELGWQTTDPAEVAKVRARFVRLHALLGVPSE